ncbi:hypothetical protein RFI_20797, partial [Reticulomyxa filosa]
DILITSDDQYVSLKAFQAYFNKFLDKETSTNKSKKQKQSYNEADTFIIFSTTPGKAIIDSSDPDKKKGSHFTENFCNVMLENIKLPKSLDENLRLITKANKKSSLGKEIVQVTTTCDRCVFLYKSDYYSLLHAIDKNHPWNQLNKKVHEMLNDQSAKNEVNTEVISQSCFTKDWILQSQEQEYIQHFTCLICKQIANNAMQIVCSQHKDSDEALIVGEKCLQLFLKKNKECCPIQPNHNCQYLKAKMPRNYIDKLQVICLRQFEQEIQTLNKIKREDD